MAAGLIDLEGLAARAQAKHNALAALAALTPAERRAVLAELLFDESNAAATAAPAPKAATPSGTSHVAKPSGGARRSHHKKKSNGKKAESPARTATLLATLAAHPRMPVRDLAMAVYGSNDSKAQDKTRSLLAAQKNAKKVNNPKPGEWEVVAKANGAE